MTTKKTIPPSGDQELRPTSGIVAVSQLSRKINASLDLQETLDAIVSAVVDLVQCSLAEIDLWDEENQMLVLQAIRSVPERDFPIGKSFPAGNGYTGWVIQNRKPLLVPDVDSRHDLSPEILPGELPFKAYVGLPLLAMDKLVGALVLVHDEVDAFNEDDLQLLEALAGQAAIAIRNARIHDNLTRHLRELSALYSVAEAINHPLELKNILERSLDSVLEVTQADGAAIRLLDIHTNEAVLAAYRGLSERYIQEADRVHISRDIIGAVMRSGKATLSDDMWADSRVSPELRELLLEVGHRSLAQVPLVAQEQVVGVLGIVSSTLAFFDDDDLKLLTAIGQQLGVAIDNAQLFEETQSNAHKLAAINAVSAVINQPLSLQVILDQAITKVLELTEVEGGGIRLLNQETSELSIISSFGLSPELIQALKPDRLGEGIVGTVAQSGNVRIVKDLSRDPDISSVYTMVKEGFKCAVFVPLRVKDEIVGTLEIITRQQREFTSEDVELLTAIGDQIGMAIDNARLYTDLTQRARELEAVNLVAAAVNQPGDLDQILKEGLKQILVVMNIEMGTIGVRDFKNDTVSLRATQGLPSYLIEEIKAQEEPHQFTHWPEGLDILIQEVDLENTKIPSNFKEKGIRVIANIPLFAEGERFGVLRLFTDRKELKAEERSLLLAIANQLGIAIANARLRQEVLQAERMAAVGRVAASVAHDLRSPLGGILRSTEFLARPEISFETRQKLSQAVVSLARRLIGTSQEILDYIQGEPLPLKLEPCNLSDFLEEVLTVLQVDFSDQGIEVSKVFHYKEDIVMDADRMAQVIYNIATNARNAMPQGGDFQVETQKVGENIILRFSDTGVGVPKELANQIFEPFFSYGKRQGAGLGLSIARRIVEEHGGTLHLASKKSGQGATFVLKLPA
jgi:GAF domain-containing protein